MTFHIGSAKFDFTTRLSQFLMTIIQVAIAVFITVSVYDWNVPALGAMLIGFGVLMIGGVTRRAVGGRD